MKLTQWPLDTLILDKEDINLIATKRHPWQKDMGKKNGALDKSDWFALPQPYMLGIQDAQLHYKKGVGKYGKGFAEANYTITQEDPWFWSHFIGDPVMPGAQGQDAFTQLGGMWAAGSCAISGRGRALQGSFTYDGQILPTSKIIYYRLDVVRFLKKKGLLFFDGYLAVDTPENIIYRFGEHKVGFFTRAELGLSEGKNDFKYHPDWEKVKGNTRSWIKDAQDFYSEEK